MLSLSVNITGLKHWTSIFFFFFFPSLDTNFCSHHHFAHLVSQSLIPPFLLFFPVGDDLEGIPAVLVQAQTSLSLFLFSSLCSVFISGLSQPAQGRPGAVLTLQAYWLWKREKIPWTWFIIHEPHDTSFICSFFSMESTADKPHFFFFSHSL